MVQIDTDVVSLCMAFTLRLPASLSERATAYAESIGVSVAALVAIALADYLDSRARREGGPPAPAPDARGDRAPAAPEFRLEPAVAVAAPSRQERRHPPKPSRRR